MDAAPHSAQKSTGHLFYVLEHLSSIQMTHPGWVLQDKSSLPQMEAAGHANELGKMYKVPEKNS